ncbi:MAG: hypothetical protein IKA26_07335 [Alistipes sp.]|nr:hypothetical protein [Alistipes sp.]
MKKIYFLFSVICVATLSSCASIFCGSKAKILLSDTQQHQPVNITTDCKHYRSVMLPKVVKIKRGFKPSNVRVDSEGYKPIDLTITKKFNGVSVLNLANVLGWGIDAASGAIAKPTQKAFFFTMERLKETAPASQPVTPIIYVAPAPTTEKAEEKKAVSRENPGQTALEQTIIRWFIDSDPRGARVFWRVISSVPAEVKNTNETYLMTTPYEETRSFNILGLTYENSRDVTIEIKITKRGYEDQVKRFNVRQAIDQQEISSFFELVPKPEMTATTAH